MWPLQAAHNPVAVLDRDWAAAAGRRPPCMISSLQQAALCGPRSPAPPASCWRRTTPAGTDPALRELAEQLSTQRAATVAWIIDGISIRDRAALREESPGAARSTRYRCSSTRPSTIA